MSEGKSSKILNFFIVVLSVVLVTIALFLWYELHAERPIDAPVVNEENEWDSSSSELYVTADHAEFSDVYDELGASDDLIQLNEDIVLKDLTEGKWYLAWNNVEYTVIFGEGDFTVSGGGTTTTGDYKIEYRSDAPQYMYLTMTSPYVSIEGFIGYVGDYVYVYSDVEDEGQMPPASDYCLLRREIDG